MNKTITVLSGALLLAMPGCATLKDSTLLGAGVGAAGGAGMGLAVEQSAGSALIGTAIGAVIGGAFGYLGHKEKEKKEMLSKVGPRRLPVSETIPELKAPEANCITVPEKVEGHRYVGPHILCTIEKQAVWSR